MLDVIALVLISLAAVLSLGGLPGWLLNAVKVMRALGLTGLLVVFASPGKFAPAQLDLAVVARDSARSPHKRYGAIPVGDACLSTSWPRVELCQPDGRDLVGGCAGSYGDRASSESISDLVPGAAVVGSDGACQRSVFHTGLRKHLSVRGGDGAGTVRLFRAPHWPISSFCRQLLIWW
jgi:hypothetical protein